MDQAALGFLLLPGIGNGFFSKELLTGLPAARIEVADAASDSEGVDLLDTTGLRKREVPDEAGAAALLEDAFGEEGGVSSMTDRLDLQYNSVSKRRKQKQTHNDH